MSGFRTFRKDYKVNSPAFIRELKRLYDEKSSTFKFFIFLSLVFLSAVLHILFALFIVYFFVDGGPDLIKYQDLNSQVSINYLKFFSILVL